MRKGEKVTKTLRAGAPVFGATGVIPAVLLILLVRYLAMESAASSSFMTMYLRL